MKDNNNENNHYPYSIRVLLTMFYQSIVLTIFIFPQSSYMIGDVTFILQVWKFQLSRRKKLTED